MSEVRGGDNLSAFACLVQFLRKLERQACRQLVLRDEEVGLAAEASELMAARRVLEVHADGTVVIPGRRGESRFAVHERFGVTVTGDYVRFIDPIGDDLGRVALRWIDPEDRIEIARRCGEMVERGRAIDVEPAAVRREAG